MFDEIARRRPATLHGGWNSHREAINTKHNPGPVEDAIEERER